MRHQNPIIISSTIRNHIESSGRELKTYSEIAELAGYPIPTFSKLRNEVSKLAVANAGSILFYRGQKNDYKRKDYKGRELSTIMPSIYREGADLASQSTMNLRWQNLKVASRILVEELKASKATDCDAVKNRRLIQWSILQHYEAALTPLIDVTQSLRVACSFAMLDNENDLAYIYVFALPYYHNRISRDSEAEITNIRLLSICPPQAKRPYLQEGFLVGEEDIDIGNMASDNFDLRKRLVAKFQIPNNTSFWDEESMLMKQQLYPDNDEFNDVCKEVSKKVSLELPPDNLILTDEQLFNFVSYWNGIEKQLKSLYGDKGKSTEDMINEVRDDSIKFRLNSTCMALKAVLHMSQGSQRRYKSYITQVGSLYNSLVEYTKTEKS